MKFEVYRTRREGRALMRHQMSGTRVVGALHVFDQMHPDLHRMSKVAQILDETGLPIVQVPTLMDATLLGAKHGWWSMAGYERLEDAPGRTVDYAQTWILIPLDEVS